jgi:hypothetical protein
MIPGPRVGPILDEHDKYVGTTVAVSCAGCGVVARYSYPYEVSNGDAMRRFQEQGWLLAQYGRWLCPLHHAHETRYTVSGRLIDMAQVAEARSVYVLEDFEPGQRVEVVVPWADGYIWYHETGAVTKLLHIGVQVELDATRRWHDNNGVITIQKRHVFAPDELEVVT